MDDELVWKRRFLISMLARLSGVAIFLFGVAVMFTDILRDGGWPQLGAILAIVGAIDAVVAPKLVRRSWERE
ncbi:MAG: hypothetical protein ABIQ32_11850 [Sphingomicrobium sp.]